MFRVEYEGFLCLPNDDKPGFVMYNCDIKGHSKGQKRDDDMNEQSFAFVVYLIHELANSRNAAPGDIYRTLKQYGCIDNYLVPNYDVLHTLGTEYLIEDINKYVSLRGGAL